MSVPAWVADAVFYHIFPDRFANGDPSNDPPGVQPWGAPPTIWGFQGGDLRGVLDHLDYLEDLGVNALLFNPIFQASSNHRYNTYDYFHIDPRLGSMADFRALLDAVPSARDADGARRRLQSLRPRVLRLPRLAGERIALAVR